jgi:hypothetical protein
MFENRVTRRISGTNKMLQEPIDHKKNPDEGHK